MMAKQQMMKVKLNCARCGQSTDSEGRPGPVFGQAAGEVVEMPADEAQRYLDRGLASLPPDTK